MTAPTPEERAEWRRNPGHRKHEGDYEEGCFGCIIVALLDALDAAEAKVARVEALAARWTLESDERGPEDRVYTSGVASMLRHALNSDA